MMPPPSLQSIPPELTIQIAECLGINDLSSLIRVSHQFHSLLSSRLYTLGALWSPDRVEDYEIITPLSWCLRNDQRAAANKLLLKKANPVLVSGGTTAIHEAVKRDYVDVLRLMLDRSCPIKDLRNGLDETLLVTAARIGREACARALLDREQGWDLIDALQVAVNESQEAIVRLILGLIAAPFNFPDDQFDMILLSAVEKGHAGILRRLLTFAATAFIEFDISKETNALAPHAKDKACIDVFFRLGADINYRAHWGLSFLHSTVLCRNCEAAAHLLDRGANIDAADMSGTTPLMLAASIADGEAIAQLLIDRGANLGPKDWDGLNAMHMAASRGFTEMVELLHRAGISVQASTDERWTALHFASLDGSEDGVRYLLGAGADISAVESSGQTALHIAIKANCTDVSRALIAAGAPLDVAEFNFKTPLQYAIEKRDIYLTQLLVEESEKKKAVADSGIRDPFMNWLPEQHADGTKSYWNAGSVLHDAVTSSRENIAELLLSRQRDIHSKDLYGRTVLDWTPAHKPSLREKILSHWGDHPQTPDPKQQIKTLKQSTTILATNLLLSPDVSARKISYQHHLYALGKCLLYLGNESTARTAFALQAQCDLRRPQTREYAQYVRIVCTRCRQFPSVDRGRWVCTVCPWIDLCDRCAACYGDFMIVGEACVAHQFLEVRGEDWDALEKVDGQRVVRREWLEGLIELYSD